MSLAEGPLFMLKNGAYGYRSKLVEREGTSMRITRNIFWALTVAVTILFTACATTKFTSIWKDETYQGHPARIMIVCVSDTPMMRRLLEEEFVNELKAHGTDAIVSYTTLADQSVADRDAVDAKARQAGADTVLVMKTVGRTTGTTESAWASFEDQYIDTKTDIYDLKSGKQIWAASSETWINENVSSDTRIRSFVRAIISRMSEQKLLKPVPTSSAVNSN